MIWLLVPSLILVAFQPSGCKNMDSNVHCPYLSLLYCKISLGIRGEWYILINHKPPSPAGPCSLLFSLNLCNIRGKATPFPPLDSQGTQIVHEFKVLHNEICPKADIWLVSRFAVDYLYICAGRTSIFWGQNPVFQGYHKDHTFR